MTIEERLANLERELARAKRRNRHLLVFALVAGGAAVVAAAWIGTPGKVLAESGAKAPNVVRANQFILEDADGRLRAELSVFMSGSVLRLYDENRKRRAGLDVDKDGATLDLSDENGYPRARLSAGKDGLALALADEKGKVRVMLDVDKDGPGLRLCDENRRRRAALGVDNDGPALGLFDEKGKVRAGMGACKTANPDGTITIYPESSLFLCDPDGKGIWKAP
jgi:hypothetical protein